jgi:hypothetical protein
MMDLKDIASVSGKSGLFKVLKPARSGVILETIDENKIKVIANANNRVSILKEVSIYTNGKESSRPLENVFEAIYEKFGKSIGIDSKSSSPEQLHEFIKSVVPDYDTEKVYTSDIKKLVSWYNILIEHFPDIFRKETKEKKDKAEAKAENQEGKETLKQEGKAKKEVSPAPKGKAKEPKAEKGAETGSKAKSKSSTKK